MSKDEIMFDLLQKTARDSWVDLDWRNWDCKGLYCNFSGLSLYITLAESLKENKKMACEVLSHELGHHYMHRGKMNMNKYLHDSPERDENYVNLIEAEADAFGKGLITGLEMIQDMLFEIITVR